ncbi:NHL repeat-containing protein 2 [Mactra antiquata]
MSTNIMADFNDVLEACNNLHEKLEDKTSDRTENINKHLDLIENKLQYTVPEFQTGLEWINIGESLSFTNHLKGKIVILDFFTYCCINCMHILPDLEAVEERFSIQDGVVVLGVHSAKFDNERLSSNILSAVLRYNIHHPVVNDGQAVLWSELQIACWPTLVIVGPSGQYLYQLIGEGHREELIEFVSVAKKYYSEKGQITHQAITIRLEPSPSSPLRFPGKIYVSDDGQTVVISDTGHHRVLVTDKSGHVQQIIGGKGRGYKDGTFNNAMFSSPQGVCLLNSQLYIADTDNHVIRKADLDTGEVITVTGTSSQGNDKEGGGLGTSQEISSPWDVCVADSPDGQKNSVLYIAMAGNHQIWACMLKDVLWYKNKQLYAGTCLRFAGSGLEENRNNSYPEKAGFAQPSGITVSMKQNCLYVADSESSSVRSIQLKDGAVKNVVGGDIDPKNLFAYGDIDGTGNKAKLQHPLGVVMVTDDGPLLLVDSYNHKVKSVDISNRKCQTMLGTGKAGSTNGDNLSSIELNEPGGIACDWRNKLVYIADTNNHHIKILDLQSQKVQNLSIIFPSSASKDTDILQYNTTDGTDDVIKHGVRILLQIHLADGIYLNDQAPNSWSLYCEDTLLYDNLKESGVKLKGELTQELQQTLTIIPSTDIVREVCLKLNLFICEDSGVCRMDKKILTSNIEPSTCEETFILDLN